VPEREKVFPNLTVAEHFKVVKASPEAISEVHELFPSLRERASSPAGLLSGGERQMLALGVAFCMQPKILLIDELSLGLAPVLIKRLLSALREYQSRSNIPILLVEQNVGAALELADRVYILEGGQIDLAGDASEISREALISSSLGD
jgi:ABC-type branched-subunit amino acid transport system ATPase component